MARSGGAPVSASIIKSIQRGTTSITANSQAAVITISAVNPAKCVVTATIAQNGQTIWNVWLVAIDSTSITLGSGVPSTSLANVVWQVVEYI